MALPELTAQQRADALAKAQRARKARAELLAGLKAGTVQLPEVFERAETDEVVRKTRIIAVIKALPGVGPVRAAELMRGCEIADSRRVGGVGSAQRSALLAAVS
jgi:hypothetical protein